MRLRIRHYLRVVLAVAAGILIAGTFAPVASAADNPIVVDLGTHEFGHLTAAAGVAVHARPDQVGFYQPAPGEDRYGPWSFQVAADGSVWLLDEVNNRLLYWRPGQPDRPSATIPVGPPGVWDFVVTPDHNVYYTTILGGMVLHAVTATGQPRWQAPLAENGQLWMGPDGVVYLVGYGDKGWIPVTTVDGRPLSVADQQRLTRKNQPLPGGGSLAVTWAAAQHQVDVAVLDTAGRTTRAWRVTSTTSIEGTGLVPAMVGGEPVIGVGVYEYPSDGSVKVEKLILQLTATGTRSPIVIARQTYGDAVTDLLVGADGAFYQLTTDPRTGVTISRYPLAGSGQPAPTGSAAVPTPTAAGQPAPTATNANPPATQNAPAADVNRTSGGSTGWLWLAAAGLLAVVLSTVGALLILRRRRATSNRREVDQLVGAGVGGAPNTPPGSSP